MPGKNETTSKTIDALTIVLFAAIVLLIMNLVYVGSEAREEHRKVQFLRKEIATLKKRPAAKNYDVELDRLRRDIDVCHKRATDIWNALDTVAKTCPGRARPPRIPDRKRPTYERRTNEPPVPRPAKGPL